jgi:hypothetical protein
MNAVMLFIWFFGFTLMHDTMNRFITAMLRRPIPNLDTIHVAGIALLKLLTIMLTLIPWLALTMMR